MKIFKTTFVFVLFFSCVCSLTAQVMETVTYTPSKSGRYGTITTRSLATFSGDVSVNGGNGEVVGLGDKFTVDTKQGYSRGGNHAVFSAGRNIFTSVTASPTNGAYVGGNLNTTKNAYITQLNAQKTSIYGGDANFANSNVKVNRTGILEIDRVKMKNPNCDIKWVKLPAYKASSDYGAVTNPTPTLYWFAYCDSATNTTPDNNEWNASISTINALGTCLAHTGNCNTDESNSSRHVKYFTCSDIAVYQCTSSYNTTDKFNTYKYTTNATMPYYHDESYSGLDGHCSGSIIVWRYAATNSPGTYRSTSGQVAPIPVDSRGCYDQGSQVDVPTQQQVNNILNAYCGMQFLRQGTNSYQYTSYAQDVYYKMTHSEDCSHSNTKLTLCNELGNYSYNDWATVMTAYNNHTYSSEDLCNLIETGHGSSLSSSFSCVLNPPSPTSFTYYKTVALTPRTVQHKKCKSGTCLSHNTAYVNGHALYADNQLFCKYREKNYTSFTMYETPSGYVTGYRNNLICYPTSYFNTLQQMPAGRKGVNMGAGTMNWSGSNVTTRYLNQKMQNTSILNCSRD